MTQPGRHCEGRARRHCEEQSDEAIHATGRGERMDGFAALAMTGARVRRHCEPKAKQSTRGRRRGMDCFAALAMTGAGSYRDLDYLGRVVAAITLTAMA